MREPHVCHVPACWPPIGRANQATSLHLNNPDSQRKWKTRLRPPASAVSVCGVVGRGCSSTRFPAPWAHTRCTRNTHTQTCPDVGLREQGPACGSGRCCGATRVCPRARVRVHREAQARSSVGTSSASKGAAGSPLPGPVQPEPSPGGPLWGRRVWGRGARPAQAWQPRRTPRGHGPGLPPQCLESGRPRAQRWAPHTQWRRRSVGTAPVEKGAPGAAAGAWGAARRGSLLSRAGQGRGGRVHYVQGGGRPAPLSHALLHRVHGDVVVVAPHGQVRLREDTEP